MAAIAYAVVSRRKLAVEATAEAAGGENYQVFLTERSGFDACLQALDLPPGSEVLVSAVTIDDMVQVIRHHGLVPVPIDINPADMSPCMELLEQARTDRTRAVLIAHLFGVRLEMGPVVDWARQHELLIFEDCAQAFEGDRYPGHTGSDVVMFSFGPIKTATALGGGLVHARDPRLREAMRHYHACFQRQTRVSFLKRVAVYAVLKAISTRWTYGALVALCRLARIDYDRMLSSAVRNVPGDDLFAALRQQPCAPLAQLMTRRLTRFNPRRLDERRRKGRLLADRLAGCVPCPGADAEHHSFWIFPVCVSDRVGLIQALRRRGFDATAGGQLRAVDPPADRPELEPRAGQRLLDDLVWLPVYPEMPDREVERLAETVRRFVS